LTQANCATQLANHHEAMTLSCHQSRQISKPRCAQIQAATAVRRGLTEALVVHERPHSNSWVPPLAQKFLDTASAAPKTRILHEVTVSQVRESFSASLFFRAEALTAWVAQRPMFRDFWSGQSPVQEGPVRSRQKLRFTLSVAFPDQTRRNPVPFCDG